MYLIVEKIEEDIIKLENCFVLKSIILGDMLEEGQLIAPYVLTVGHGLDFEFTKIKDDFISKLILDHIGKYAIEIARKKLSSIIECCLGNNLSSFGPGTGKGDLFRLDQQEIIFQILNPSENIGVEILPNYLMLPKLSISGIFASTLEEYIACKYCPRKCGYRKAKYLGEYNNKK